VSYGDALWSFRAPDGSTATFVVETRQALLGPQLNQVLAQLAELDAIPLVATPHLSPTLRASLANRGVSYVDSTGNLQLLADAPGLFVERSGSAKDPWPSDDTLRTLRGRGAGRAVRALVDFRTPYGVRDLARRAGVPLGSLSRVLDLLSREGLVPRDGIGTVALCSIDPLTQLDHSATIVEVPADGVLIVDGVFALRPELDGSWNLRIWLAVDPELSVPRGMARGAFTEGGDDKAEALHRNRYLAPELIYMAGVDPEAVADVVIDNTDFERPVLLRS